MKATKIIYWVTTIFLFLFEGVMPALTGNTELAKQGIASLGYPDYFRVTLNIFKIAGSVLLILPMIKGRLKEWVYAGFAFDFIFATISHVAVNGPKPLSFFPVIILVVLVISYVTYHKIQDVREVGAVNRKLTTL